MQRFASNMAKMDSEAIMEKVKASFQIVQEMCQK